MQLPNRPWNGMYALDAFCNIGGAGMGLYLAGFEVVGVDILPQPNYPFEFRRGDAVEFIRRYGSAFHLISGGPPCQYDCMLTAGTNKAKRDQYPDLLEPTRNAMLSTGRPYIIEQPPGRASKRMQIDVTLCGEMFGLGVLRHRNFELGGWATDKPTHIPHRGRVAGMRHGQWFTGPYFQVYGNGGGKGTVTQWQHAMGIHWTDIRRELAEAIPPAYTQWLGTRYVEHHHRTETTVTRYTVTRFDGSHVTEGDQLTVDNNLPVTYLGVAAGPWGDDASGAWEPGQVTVRYAWGAVDAVADSRAGVFVNEA